MTFLELANKRYSARKYKDQPIEKEKLDQVLEAGRIAPTAKNNQPVKIYVLQSKKALEKISDKTIIVVTHRLSFVENFDRIFVVNDGKIVEEGTHQQLLDQQGVYESMYRKQNGS